MTIHFPQGLIAAVHDDIDALLAQTALQTCVETQLPLEELFARAVRFDVEVDVATASGVVHARAEQLNAGVPAEDLHHLLSNDVPFALIEPHASDLRCTILITSNY